MEELEEASALFAAGGNCGPHPFVISLARCAASPLGNATVDHAVTHLLFAMVVGRFNTRLEHEPKAVRPMLSFFCGDAFQEIEYPESNEPNSIGP